MRELAAAIEQAMPDNGEHEAQEGEGAPTPELVVPGAFLDYVYRLGQALRLFAIKGWGGSSFTSVCVVLFPPAAPTHGTPGRPPLPTAHPYLLYELGPGVTRVPPEAETLLLQCGLHAAYPTHSMAEHVVANGLPLGFAACTDSRAPYRVPAYCADGAPDPVVTPASDLWHRAAREALRMLPRLKSSAAAASVVQEDQTAAWQASLESTRPSLAVYVKAAPPRSQLEQQAEAEAAQEAKTSKNTDAFTAALARVAAEVSAAFSDAPEACRDAAVLAVVDRIKLCAEICAADPDRRSQRSQVPFIGAPNARQAEVNVSAYRHLLGPSLRTVTDANALLHLVMGLLATRRAVEVDGVTYTAADPMVRLLAIDGDNVLTWHLAAAYLQANRHDTLHVDGTGYGFRAVVLEALTRGRRAGRPPSTSLLQALVGSMSPGDDVVELFGESMTRLELLALACKLAPNDAQTNNDLAIALHAHAAHRSGEAAGGYTDPESGVTFTAWGCAERALHSQPSESAVWDTAAQVMPDAVDAAGGVEVLGRRMRRLDCAVTSLLLRNSAADDDQTRHGEVWCTLAHAMPWPAELAAAAGEADVLAYDEVGRVVAPPPGATAAVAAGSSPRRSPPPPPRVRVGPDEVTQLECLERAVRREPKLGRAWAGLARYLREASHRTASRASVRIGPSTYTAADCEAKAAQYALTDGRFFTASD
jgi:hypothetical protein